MVPLSFVAETLDYETFDPEASGLLIHEYLDKVYLIHPELNRSFKKLKDKEILHLDPLKEQLNPYNRRNYNVGNFKAYLESMLQDNVNGDERKEDKPIGRFQLSPAEVKEYLRPTISPLSAYNQPKSLEDEKNEDEENDEEYDNNGFNEDEIPDFLNKFKLTDDWLNIDGYDLKILL